ncbi:glycosyltransferase family 2 protein [Enterococcus pseudoavium]|uniref:Glycosyltransferase family 2 protein n=1 Tax=Enterococcus pseudoavium TaxID=44007 RepID=A0AAE4L1X0_9ENTE|nr:glycosyltransferase family 2 protein [Enterococcus pseudoavium]MDT2737236.1 glycosyltransferase family 2 protein [Enterococcus pseudoavium]
MCEISIIVPVYNVEKYLNKCVDSILNQTFKDFEVILVDDGSPDNSGAICDQYAEKDSRVKVVHKKNGGLSDARNAGIDISTGNFLSFIDSDDYIDNDMIDILYDDITQKDGDISVVGYYDEYGGIVKNCKKNKDKIEILSRETAIEKILEGKELTANVWNKLYKRELFEKIRFMNNVIAEDAFIIVELLLLCNKVVVNKKFKYHYVHRKGSITTSVYSIKDLDTIKAWEYNLLLLKERVPKLSNKAFSRVCWANFFVLDKLSQVERKSEEETEVYKKIKNFLLKNMKHIFNSHSFTKNRKISLFVLLLSDKLYGNLVKKNNSNNWR